MKNENTTGIEEYFDESQIDELEHMAMTEDEIVQGLCSAYEYKNDESNYKTVRIARNGKLYFSFRIRPITEEEEMAAVKQATPMSGNRKERRSGVKAEADASLYRAYKIYVATIDEDREKLWDNQQAKRKMNVIHGAELIDKVFMAGEKDRVCSMIDEISDPDDKLTKVIKN